VNILNKICETSTAGLKVLGYDSRV
jgi:hypothetical protein